MSEHHVFTGSAGMGPSSADGWTHTVPDSLPLLGGEPARYVARRSESDRWHGFAWFVLTVFCLTIMAAASKTALSLLLSWLGLM